MLPFLILEEVVKSNTFGMRARNHDRQLIPKCMQLVSARQNHRPCNLNFKLLIIIRYGSFAHALIWKFAVQKRSRGNLFCVLFCHSNITNTGVKVFTLTVSLSIALILLNTATPRKKWAQLGVQSRLIFCLNSTHSTVKNHIATKLTFTFVREQRLKKSIAQFTK